MPPRRQNNQKLEEGQNNNEAAGDDDNLTTSALDILGTDEIAFIFGFLPPHDIMSARLNKKMRDAAKTTIAPMSQFLVNSVDKYNAIDVMTIALPNLQQIEIGYLGSGHKYIDGYDPDERMAAETINFISHDIEIICNFEMLRSLVVNFAPLNGRYPLLFNFPLLNKLSITTNWKLKWDLEVLAGLPVLKELYLNDNKQLTGNINSLRVLRETLAKVEIIDCKKVEGNFMDLADFPHVNELNLCHTAVIGDIREIGAHDFPALKSLSLPKGVYGGDGQEFQSISDAHDTISFLYSFRKQRPPLLKYWSGKLSGDSPDWYDADRRAVYNPAPMYVVFVEAGSRVGYRWETAHDVPTVCEVNWLDPEPDRYSSDYEKYIEELQEINGQVDIYRGYHQPPTRDEYWTIHGMIEDY
mmetsp:Transcript_2531/g.5587  ORF Transcript_2531/g.5587 Transcript_2531/m.5587 type:complete len:412 (-) Transcript_2531:136-1371(-)